VTEDFTEPEEVLSAFDRLERDPTTLHAVACAPPAVVLRCLAEGFLVKRGAWAMPVLTDKGKARLRRWRTCWDCHAECVGGVHQCPARRPASPYRSV
jgi:hypothetical protein